METEEERNFVSFKLLGIELIGIGSLYWAQTSKQKRLLNDNEMRKKHYSPLFNAQNQTHRTQVLWLIQVPMCTFLFAFFLPTTQRPESTNTKCMQNFNAIQSLQAYNSFIERLWFQWTENFQRI